MNIDLALVAVTDEWPARGEAARRWEGLLPPQLPLDVEWRRALPVVLDRLRTERDTEEQIRAMAARRTASVFDVPEPPIPPRRRRPGWRRRPD